MSAEKAEKDGYYDCSFVSIHYIICECGETFPSENGLRAHLEKEHPHKRERKEFKCGVCGSVFNTEDDCIAHYEETHIITDFKQEESEEEDFKPDHTDHEEYQDQSEQEHFEPDDSVHEEYKTGHVKQEHFNPGHSELPILQETNQKVSVELTNAGVEGLDLHEGHVLHIPDQYGQVIQESNGQLVLLVNKLKVDKVNKIDKPDKPKKYRNIRDIVCEVCGKKYSSNAALKYHQRVHTGERPYKCHICPKSFTMPLFLQIHIRTHTGERPYQCPDCPKAFSNKAALLRHDRVHTGEKPYQCPMCLKTFTQSNSMKLHVHTVHLKNPAPYKSKSRKLKAAERLLKQGKNPKNTNTEYETVTIELEQGVEAQPLLEGETECEVVESEVVSDGQDGDCYTLVYGN